MPKLGEVIGALLSDVARARVRADAEAMRIASAYSGDPLLKHLPVPRFRLPEVVIDLPVLVDGVDEPDKDSPPWPSSAAEEQEIREAARTQIVKSGVRLTPRQIASASAAPARRARELYETGTLPLRSPEWVAREMGAALAAAVDRSTERDLSPRQLEAISSLGKVSMQPLVAKRLVPPPSVDVVLASAAIKENADNANVVNIRLTISEDAFEVVDRDDGEGFYLTPE